MSYECGCEEDKTVSVAGSVDKLTKEAKNGNWTFKLLIGWNDEGQNLVSSMKILLLPNADGGCDILGSQAEREYITSNGFALWFSALGVVLLVDWALVRSKSLRLQETADGMMTSLLWMKKMVPPSLAADDGGDVSSACTLEEYLVKYDVANRTEYDICHKTSTGNKRAPLATAFSGVFVGGLQAVKYEIFFCNDTMPELQ